MTCGALRRMGGGTFMSWTVFTATIFKCEWGETPACTSDIDWVQDNLLDPLNDIAVADSDAATTVQALSLSDRGAAPAAGRATNIGHSVHYELNEHGTPLAVIGYGNGRYRKRALAQHMIADNKHVQKLLRDLYAKTHGNAALK